MIALFGFVGATDAQIAGYNRNLTPLGYCQITSLASAVSLATSSCSSGSVPANATYALVEVETAAVRWRADGVAPTASVGMPIAIGGSQTFYLVNLGSIQFIAETGSPVVNVFFYR